MALPLVSSRCPWKPKVLTVKTPSLNIVGQLSRHRKRSLAARLKYLASLKVSGTQEWNLYVSIWSGRPDLKPGAPCTPCRCATGLRHAPTLFNNTTRPGPLQHDRPMRSNAC